MAAVPEGTASRKVGGRPLPPDYSAIQPFPWATKLDRVRLQTGAEASKKNSKVPWDGPRRTMPPARKKEKFAE